MLFQLFLDEHEKEADQEQHAGEPDRSGGKQGDQTAADACAEGKHENDAEVAEGLVQRLTVACLAVGTQGFHAASDISDAHGTREGVAVDLAERLHLHGAGEGYHCIGEDIHILGDDSDHKEQQDLD